MILYFSECLAYRLQMVKIWVLQLVRIILWHILHTVTVALLRYAYCERVKILTGSLSQSPTMSRENPNVRPTWHNFHYHTWLSCLAEWSYLVPTLWVCDKLRFTILKKKLFKISNVLMYTYLRWRRIELGPDPARGLKSPQVHPCGNSR
jgi:hypothetical protein